MTNRAIQDAETVAERAGMGLDDPSDPRQLGRKSVVSAQTQITQSPSSGGFDQVPGLSMFYLAGAADGIQPWGLAPTYRDRQLRALFPTEPYTMGAIATINATNQGLDWILEGTPKTVEAVQDMLHGAQFAEGWEAWVGKTSMDFYTQDKGAFSELVRDFDTPDAPVVGFNHLDAARCWHTGNLETPVLYQDRNGRWHGLKWYQVLTFREMPAPHEFYYGLQYCALTRIQQVTQILRNIFTLQAEKTSGRYTRRIVVISGINVQEIEDAMVKANATADAAGQTRYMIPVIVSTLDPSANVKKEEIALADLPDDWGEHLDDYMKWYMVAISMGLLRDFQDFAPLPGGGLGTSAQSEMLHMKTRGKGPALWQKRIEQAFNFRGVMPANVKFKFDETDLEEEQANAAIMETYASALTALMSAAVMDAEAARQLLLDNKLISQDMFDGLAARAEEMKAEQEAQQAAELAALNGGDPNARPRPGAPRGPQAQPRSASDGDTSSGARDSGARESELAERGMTMEFDDDRVVVEDRLTARAQRALTLHGRDIRKRLGE